MDTWKAGEEAQNRDPRWLCCTVAAETNDAARWSNLDFYYGWLHRLQSVSQFCLDKFSDDHSGRQWKDCGARHTNQWGRSVSLLSSDLSSMLIEITFRSSTTVSTNTSSWAVSQLVDILFSWGIRQESTFTIGDWKYSKVENPLWHRMALTWPVDGTGSMIAVRFDKTCPKWLSNIQSSRICNGPSKALSYLVSHLSSHSNRVKPFQFVCFRWC